VTTRIQLRRDTAANWNSNNPVLLPGELGIETDTLKFKIGNGTRWSDTNSYAFKVGEANGLATLGSDGKLSMDQLPDFFSITDAVAQAISNLSTTDIHEGNNLYFTNQRAIDAVSSAISNAVSSALTTANSNAQSKADGAVALSNNYTNEQIQTTTDYLVGTMNSKVSQEVTNRNTAINSAIANLRTTQITEGTNKYFTDQRARDAVADDISSAVANAISSHTINLATKTTDDLAEGSINEYFTISKARSAAAYPVGLLRDEIGTALIDLTNLIQDSQTSITTINNTIDSAGYLTVNDRNVAGGVAGLDNTVHIPVEYIPSTIARSSDVTTQIDSRIQSIIGSAPSSLDTLAELAAALNGDNSMDEVITASLASKLAIDTAAATYETLAGAASKYATISNLNLKAPLNSPTFTGTVSGITKSMIGLSNVDNTSDLLKPISTATANALLLKAPLDSPSFTGTIDFTNVTVTGLNLGTTIPSQQDNSGKFLTTDGSGLYWTTISNDLSGYLTASSAASTYLTISDAANSYATISNAQIYGYHNASGGIISNKIAYGTSATPTISSPNAGDIYIQY